MIFTQLRQQDLFRPDEYNRPLGCDGDGWWQSGSKLVELQTFAIFTIAFPVPRATGNRKRVRAYMGS